MIFRLTLKRLFSNKFNTIALVLALSLAIATYLTFQFAMKSFSEKLNFKDMDELLLVSKDQNHFNALRNTLLFKSESVPFIQVNEVNELNQFKPILVFNNYTAKKYPIIGIDDNFFSQTKLEFSQGRKFINLGECALGSYAAAKLKLSIGDTLITDTTSSFDVSKSNPVKLVVCGIIKTQNSPIDSGIFTSLKSAWTIHGIGHDHTENEESTISTPVDLSKGPTENFHFHGTQEEYPLTGALIYFKDGKEKADLLAVSQSGKFKFQIINPKETINKTLNRVANLDEFFKLIFKIVLVLLILLLAVLVYQTSSLRKSESEVYTALGIPRIFILKMAVCEWVLIFIICAFTGYMLSIILNDSIQKYVTALFS